jgi:hypothetical protein
MWKFTITDFDEILHKGYILMTFNHDTLKNLF